MKRKLLFTVLIVLCTHLICSCAFAINAFPDGTYQTHEKAIDKEHNKTNDIQITIEVCRGNGYIKSTAFTILPKRIVFYEDGTFVTSGCVGKWAVEKDSKQNVTCLLLTGLDYEFEVGQMTNVEYTYRFERNAQASREMPSELIFDIEIE